jgi:hypothetical protein
MKRATARLAALALGTVALALGGAAFGSPWDTVVFEDDFEGVALDGSKWIINHPGETWWVQGRTHFPDPETTVGPFPHVDGGACILEHHLYNPYHLGTPKTTFLGGEVRTVQEFTPDKAYRFEARVRNGAYPNGVVTSDFLYGFDGTASDEIDYEFVSKQTNDDTAWPSADPVLTNTWDESQQDPAYAAPAGLVLTDEWVTLRFYWYPSEPRIDWTWMDTVGGETLLRSENDASRIPDEPMNLYFNFWAADANWPDAYDADLEPAQLPDDNQVLLYEIDYVEVRTPEPGTAVLVALGVLGWLCSRRRVGRGRLA